MQNAVVIKVNMDNNRLYGSKAINIDIISMIAPKAKNRIELEDLFMKNTNSGRMPRLNIKTRSGINPVKIMP